MTRPLSLAGTTDALFRALASPLCGRREFYTMDVLKVMLKVQSRFKLDAAL